MRGREAVRRGLGRVQAAARPARGLVGGAVRPVGGRFVGRRPGPAGPQRRDSGPDRGPFRRPHAPEGTRGAGDRKARRPRRWKPSSLSGSESWAVTPM